MLVARRARSPGGVIHRLDRFLQKPTLPYSRVAFDHDRLSLAGTGGPPGAENRGQLLLPPD
jgi:hypothetical protein